MGRGPRIKRQPAKFRVRVQTEPGSPELPVKQYKLTGVIMAGTVLCAAAYLIGLVIGSQLRH